MTLERRAAAMQLARLLTGATGAELRGRRINSVAFQQAPGYPVDDLLVSASRDGGTDPLVLSIAVRRSPPFTASDADTQKLVGDLLAEVARPRPGVESRVAVCVAGPQAAAQQVAQLAALAAAQSSAVGFTALVRTPGRFQRALVDRLGHLERLVHANLGATADEAAVQSATWDLLVRLDVLMPRLEPPDETDWHELVNQLEPWAREPTIAAGSALRDRLETLAGGYAPSAAVVDLAKLRRDAHDVLHLNRRRRAAAWEEIRRLDREARAAVRSTVGVDGDEPPLRLARAREAARVRDAVRPGQPVIVFGDSGIGKSALALSELTQLAADDPHSYEVACLNLRMLPRTVLELRDAVGAPLEDVFKEMSAVNRVLVIDAAEVVTERDDQLLRPLLEAARSADVTPWVIAATDARAAVQAVVEAAAGPVAAVAVEGLDDAELDEVAERFTHLRRLIEEPRAKELLRRPAVADLFVRSGSQRLPLSEADAFDIVWARLVRDDERSTQGLPDARDQAMMSLAAHELRPGDEATVYASLNAAAVGGLQHDGLLRRGDRWRTLPVFAHDLIRAFAVARLLVAGGDPVGALLDCGAPRWALPAARLAVQVLLTAPDSASQPLEGRLARVQAEVDRLAEAGHGDRWRDLPTEAVVTLASAADLLDDGWPATVAGDAAGLRRLLRVVLQRHGRSMTVDPLIAEPVVGLLLSHGWPAGAHEQVHELLSAWLRGLLTARTPAGHPLREALRRRLVERVAAGDERLERAQREERERLAARTPEEVAADEERDRELDALNRVASLGGGRRRAWRELPGELTEDDLLEELALLGPDLGEDGERVLRRVAADAPHHLAPAVEAVLAGYGLAAHDVGLLVHLVEAYYIEDRDDDDEFGGFGGFGDDGIRHHELGPVTPLAAFYRGPFLAMLRVAPRSGIACLNRLLNHAARARAGILRRPHTWGGAAEPEENYVVGLDLTGERRRYIGDAQVWFWYRGTGVGPYPCLSALQALDLVCDELLDIGVSPAALVKLLLDGCENLAMPALVFGVLVRHVDRVTTELDAFLSEPAVWHLEFARRTHEYSGLAAAIDGIRAPERRGWTPREVAMALVLASGEERREALRLVSGRLVARAVELGEGDNASEELAAVRGWARCLDADNYRATTTAEGVMIEHVPDPEVVSRLAETNADLERGQDATRILMRYPERFDHHAGQRTEVTREELLADLATARALAEDPPAAGPLGPYDGPAAVAAAALEARFTSGVDVPEADLLWAARLLVEILLGLAESGASEDDYSVFGRGADRAAARALPLLFLPDAEALRRRLANEGVDDASLRLAVAWVTDSGSNETRLFLVRGFDSIWTTPCDERDGSCHHAFALGVVEDTARLSLIGKWDPSLQRNARPRIEGPVAPRLAAVGSETVYVPQLTPIIRGAGAAAASPACCRADAATLLAAAVAAHRRGMRAEKHGHHHSGNDAAVVARAVLDLAAAGDTSLLFEHIDGYADHARLLAEFLHALSAAAEEAPARASAAHAVWPEVVEHVVGFAESDVLPRDDRYYGASCVAAAIPRPSFDYGYLHREYAGPAIPWADPLALAPQIDRWLPHAAGQRESVDALAHLLHQLPVEKQAEVGLPWIEQLVMADPDEVARRSYLLPEWLESVREYAASGSRREAWHRIVDALTVAGDDRIAALAD